MTMALQRLRSTKAVTWRTIAGLLLVPITAAALLVWGLWNPTERLGDVTAAVVNLDEPVDVDGQPVPLGRVLAAELIAGDAETNYTWVLTDAEDGAGGLDDGRYATVVTIPENFSSAATSLSRGPDEAGAAHIDIATSPRGRLIDAALSNIVTQTATRVINEQLGEQFVGTVFVGMTELHRGIGEAADGADQLADGGQELADGAGELATGTAELADGTAQLSSGAGELAGGASELSGGAHGLAGGARDLADGLSAYAGGMRETAQGARDAATGSAELSAGLDEYVGGINQIIDAVSGGGSEGLTALLELRDRIANDEVPLPSPEMKEQLLELINGVIGGLEETGQQLQQLRGAGVALSDGLRASAEGQAQLASGIEGLSSGAAGLADGAAQLAGGSAELAGGADQLAGGAGELAAGVPELADGAAQLAEGTAELAAGAEQSATGARGLADGLSEAVSGIPDYSADESERMARVAVAPVEARGTSDELFASSGVPVFTGIALWAGALGVFLVLSPLWRRARTAALGVLPIALRSALPAALLGAAQGALAGVILPLVLGYDAAASTRFFALALVAGTAFSLLVQGLSALLGGLGRFVAFALLVVAFAVGIVSTAPAPLIAVGDASPIGAAYRGFQAIAAGVSGSGIAIFLLVLWGLAGLAATAYAVARARRRLTV